MALDDEVVDAVAAQGLRWIGEGTGPTALADRVGGALIAADPAEAERRAERRKRKQNVSTTGCGDGLAGLGPPPEGAQPVRLTRAAEQRLGGPAWFHVREAERRVGRLYALYREPERHAVQVALSGREFGGGPR